MAINAQRRLEPEEVRRFGEGFERHVTPDLTQIQTASYKDFLQEEADPDRRKVQGLESVLREIFPIESYDKQVRLDYLRYELGKPRFTPEECRQLRPDLRKAVQGLAATGQRNARRGRGLSRRAAGDDGRRRVHH